MRVGGRVLALETNKAFKAIAANSDRAFYLQADEIVHEKYLDTINVAYDNIHKYRDDKAVEGLLFNYLHFYGS